MRRQQTQVITLISILLVIGFLVTSLSGFFTARASLRSQIVRGTLPLTSDNVYSEIHRDLMRPIFVSFNMAHDTFLRDWTLNGEKDQDQVVRYLHEVRQKNHTVTSFFVSDRTGKYYHADGLLKTIHPEEPRDVWFYRVKNMKDEYEINIDLDMAHQDAMTIFINYRMLDYQGNFIGATGVGLTVTAVHALISKYQETFGSNIFFVDTLGNLTLHAEHFPKSGNTLAEMEGLSSLQKQILSRSSTSLSYRNGRNLVHVNTRYIPEFKWVLIVEQSEAKALSSIWKSLGWNLAIWLCITVLVVWFVYRILSAYQKHMETLAITDKLTGAYNRRAFSALVEQLLHEQKRDAKPTALILFDIDHFKRINDTYGHATGDRILKRIAEITRQETRRSDLFFRWGGEEFLLVLRSCTAEQAMRTAEALRTAIATEELLYEGRSIQATISLGVCTYANQETLEQWIERCDALLYQAKADGRNRTRLG